MGQRQARLYQQVFRHWRDAIASGRLPAGARLPAVRELAARHNVSLTTARRVVEELHAGGWIETRPRLGLFVAQPRQPGYPSPAGQPAPVSIATLALRLFEAARPGDCAVWLAIYRPGLAGYCRRQRPLAPRRASKFSRPWPDRPAARP